MADIKRIKKIKLSDGSIYSIFDEGALRLVDKVIYSGNAVVDEAILNGKLFIKEIDDIPLENCQEKILVADPLTGELKQQNIKAVLKSLGLITAKVTDEVLCLDTLSL